MVKDAGVQTLIIIGGDTAAAVLAHNRYWWEA